MIGERFVCLTRGRYNVRLGFGGGRRAAGRAKTAAGALKRHSEAYEGRNDLGDQQQQSNEGRERCRSRSGGSNNKE